MTRWKLPGAPGESEEGLSRAMPCSLLLAGVLSRRGVAEIEDARRFLHPKLTHLHDPFLLPGMEKAVTRIEEAVRRREPITIFGDYDVDGISSTCLLHDFFRFVGYPVGCRLPNRLLEGYGIRRDAVREIAGEGVKLIITVDNGSSAAGEVDLASELGVDVVITDHHQPGPVLPAAAAIVNPCLSGSEYPFRGLAGVGVTFKLAWALSQRFSRRKKLSDEFRNFLLESLALVALGTISDVVPLLGENRVLAKFGLIALEETRRPGLRRLVDDALGGRQGDRNSPPPTPPEGGRRLQSSDVGYRIGPRINAAGRLGQAEAALRLLLTEDPAEAAELAGVLEGENRKRQELERRIHEEARDLVAKTFDIETGKVIVLAGEGWHPGVIGIVAARIVEEFHRPTILLSREGERARGSARSVQGVDLCRALAECQECLLGFGGHAMAAGVEVELGRIDELRERLAKAIQLAPDEMVPHVDVDGGIRLEDLTLPVLRELALLAPHGNGNPQPVFMLENMDVVGEPQVLGEGGRHLSFHVRERTAVRRAIAFGKGDLFASVRRGSRVSLLLEPQLSVWQGRSDIELKVREIRIV